MNCVTGVVQKFVQKFVYNIVDWFVTCVSVLEHVINVYCVTVGSL